LALILLPSVSRAVDPVRTVQQALADKRADVIEKTIPELKTITQLRLAYFLSSWPTEDAVELDAKIEALRKKIGKALEDKIRADAKDPQVDKQIALARTIAELGDLESDKTAPRSKTGKFASRFVDLLVGAKDAKGLVHHKDTLVRQCALDALGKITPRASDARPVLAAAMKDAEIGPRRVAAFALVDLIRNAYHLEPNTEMEVVDEAVRAAVEGLKNEDEHVRAYSLQAISQAARLFIDYPRSLDSAIRIDEKRLKLEPSVAKVLETIRDTNRPVTTRLQKDSSVELRVGALDTLSQIVVARMAIMDRLDKKLEELKIPADKRPKRAALFDEFGAKDPIGALLDFEKRSGEIALKWNWESLPALVHKDNDPRLRRGAIALLETLAKEAELALDAKNVAEAERKTLRGRFVQLVTPALYDPDRIVRWTAARTLGSVSPKLIDANVIEALGHMLLERDPDLSATAAASLEYVAESPQAFKAVRFLRSALADPKKDVEIREAAMKTLVQIGGPEANDAFPELTTSLTDSDVRVRRQAAESLGLLGRPATPEIANAALAALKLALRDDDGQVRQNAAEAILTIQVPD